MAIPNNDQFETKSFANKFFPTLQTIQLRKSSRYLTYELSYFQLGERRQWASEPFTKVEGLVDNLFWNLSKFRNVQNELVIESIIRKVIYFTEFNDVETADVRVS